MPYPHIPGTKLKVIVNTEPDPLLQGVSFRFTDHLYNNTDTYVKLSEVHQYIDKLLAWARDKASKGESF